MVRRSKVDLFDGVRYVLEERKKERKGEGGVMSRR